MVRAIVLRKSTWKTTTNDNISRRGSVTNSMVVGDVESIRERFTRSR